MAVTTKKVESEIEATFLRLAERRIAVKLEPQVPLYTSVKNFRGDFVARAAGRVVLIECDGRKYHYFVTDRERDLRILKETDVTDIIRLRGCDIFFDGENTVEWVRRIAPFLFDREAKPHDEDGMLLIGATMKSHVIKPIWRVRHKEDTPDMYFKTVGNECCSLLGRCDNGDLMIQWKSPYWDWHYKGDAKAMAMSDVLSMYFGVEVG